MNINQLASNIMKVLNQLQQDLSEEAKRDKEEPKPTNDRKVEPKPDE